MLSTVGEILGFHWTATAHLKLGSPSQIGAVPPQFVCLIGCMGLMYLSIHSELNKRIGKAAMTLSRLTKRAWSNNKPSDHTKVNVYKACVISTLLYGSESWTIRAHQEKRLNVFHMRCLRRILGITWQDKVTNKVVLEKAGIPSLYTLLKQRRMRWLGHATPIKDGRILKDLLYGELATGKRPTGRP